jgi:multiple sugar transport system substrate-binding protein
MELLVPMLLFLSLASCTRLPFQGSTPTPEPSATATLTPTPTIEETSTPVGPTTLRLWLPPQFDPEDGSSAGDLLKARLDEFGKRRPNIHLEVRIKALSGPGGLLDSLSAANAAAPLALPDLILLPRNMLETAALKGLLYSLEGSIPPLDTGDWFDYAQELAHLQNSTFGLPFAGDALILLFRPAEIQDAPTDWSSTLDLTSPLIFPAADEQASFTLAEYLSDGGQVKDVEGRPTLNVDALTNVLTFYQQAEQAGVMPFWLTQYATDDQSWEGYQGGDSNLVITWTSRYLRELPVDTAAAPIPTSNGRPFTLANGWIWALSNPQIERHDLAIELAEFLTTSEFLSEWTAAAGFLPPRSSALAGWSDSVLQSLVSKIVLSAEIIPSTDVLTVLSPAMQEATVEVLKEQADPITAAQSAEESVKGP